jgi:hypothetical protein
MDLSKADRVDRGNLTSPAEGKYNSADSGAAAIGIEAPGPQSDHSRYYKYRPLETPESIRFIKLLPRNPDELSR